jgi:hypothetical protein
MRAGTVKAHRSVVHGILKGEVGFLLETDTSTGSVQAPHKMPRIFYDPWHLSIDGAYSFLIFGIAVRQSHTRFAWQEEKASGLEAQQPVKKGAVLFQGLA